MNKEEVSYKDDKEMEADIKKKQRLINVLNIFMWILLATLLLPFVIAMYCNKKLKELA